MKELMTNMHGIQKSIYNKKQGNFWFYIFILTQCLALISILLRIAYPRLLYSFTEALVVIGASIFTYIQLKRFRELAASYSLAAHEISLAKEDIEQVNSEKEFSNFVRDTENAFSREHTQWIAKKE